MPQTVSKTSTLVTQVLSLLLKGSPGCVHEHLQYCIKPAHGLQPGSSACHGGGTGLCHATRHLQGTVPVLHGSHCPSVRAEMSEGRDKVLCALTTVPNPLVLQGWSECTELLPLFILACLSDDIFSTAASSQVKKKRTYHPATIP